GGAGRARGVGRAARLEGPAAPLSAMRLLWVAMAAALAAGPVLAADPVTARLGVSGDRAVVDVTIEPGWHVPAHDPTDKFLVPTTVTVIPPAGMRAGEVRYPDAVEKALEFSEGKKLRLYEGRVRIDAALEGAPTSAEPVRATLRFQAC